MEHCLETPKVHKSQVFLGKPDLLLLLLLLLLLFTLLGVDPANTASEVCLMMSEALSLLTNCAPVDEVVTVSLNYILSFIRDTQCTMLLLASIPAACRALANIRCMVCVLEGAIGAFFARLALPGALPIPADMAAEGGWGLIMPGVSVPDLSQDEFIQGESGVSGACWESSQFLLHVVVSAFKDLFD